MPTNKIEILLLAMAYMKIQDPSIACYASVLADGKSCWSVSLYERSKFIKAFSDPSMDVVLELAIQDVRRG